MTIRSPAHRSRDSKSSLVTESIRSLQTAIVVDPWQPTDVGFRGLMNSGPQAEFIAVGR